MSINVFLDEMPASDSQTPISEDLASAQLGKNQ
jgi:hypothetical protein